MPTDKEKILKNIHRLSAEQCLNYIKEGKVSFEEMQETGNLQSGKQKEIKAYLHKEVEEQHMWDEAKSIATESGFRNYLDKYPDGKYSEEAKSRIKNAAENQAWSESKAKNTRSAYEAFINQFPVSLHCTEAKEKIEAIKNTGKQEREEWMRKLKDNPEDFPVKYIEDLIDEGHFSKRDLVEYGLLTEEALKSFFNPPEMLQAYDWVDLKPLPQGKTDVYFFGLSYSGKSMILASLLYRADQRGVLSDDISNPIGTQYKDYLINCIVRGHRVLETPRDTVNYISCTLHDEQNKRGHELSLLEMSGEYFAKAYENQNLDALQHVDGQPYLQNDNRKVIYFVIDYSTQSSHVTEQRTRLLFTLNLLDKDKTLRKTDSIHVIVSKTDLIKEEMKEDILKVFLDQNYRSFINQIKIYNKKYGINKNQNHEVVVHPFTVGNFMLSHVFEYDPKTADDLILSVLNSTAASHTKKSWRPW